MTTDLRRGTVVTYGERGEFTDKPRPGVIVQHEATLAQSPSITLCGVTSKFIPVNIARIRLQPSEANGLKEPSAVMIDKIVSISRGRIRDVVGQLDASELSLVDAALRRWLDL